MRKYETVFILKPGLGEEENKSHTEKVREQILKNGGSVISVEDWGDKRLAYEIKKNKHGYYILIIFKSNPDLISKLERYYRINESILRHLIIVLPQINSRKKDSEAKGEEPEWEEVKNTTENAPKVTVQEGD